VLDWPDRSLSLPLIGARVVGASMLKGGQRVDVAESRDGVALTLPPSTQDEPDRVVVLVTKASS
jgi:hypothetical protein